MSWDVGEIRKGDYLRDKWDAYFRVSHVLTVSYPTMVVLQPLYDPAAKRLVISELSILAEFTIISRTTRYAHGTEP